MDKQPQPNTDNLSMYDLPTLNAVISKYEQLQFEDIKPYSEAQNNLQYPQYK
jgi:hypothetical protein